MITIVTSTGTLDELEEKVLTMGQYVDQVLSKDSSSHSPIFMLVNSKDIDINLDNVTKELSRISDFSYRSGPSNRNEGEERGQGGGRNARGRGKKIKILLEL